MNQDGPYKHYERPDEPRKNSYRGSKHWGGTITIAVTCLAILMPVAYVAAKRTQPQVSEVAKVSKKKSSSSSKQTKSVKKKTSKKKAKKKQTASSKASSSSITSSVNSSSSAVSSSSSSSSSSDVSSSKTYTVQDGDTLSGIAAQFNTTVSELESLNGMTDESVSAGQTIRVR